SLQAKRYIAHRPHRQLFRNPSFAGRRFPSQLHFPDIAFASLTEMNSTRHPYDGPRSNPEDYVYYRYDGAGRPIHQIRWRSQGKANGSGVEAPAGYNLYSTTFQEYDGFGNLKRTIDARGVVTTNTWDALGRLMNQTVL